MPTTGILEVLLVNAGELKEHNFWCGIDFLLSCLIDINETKPYVSIQYGSQKHISCLAQVEGRKEVWNEKFRFNVEYEAEEDVMENDKLVLSIIDKHQFSSDFLVGKTTIYVKDIIVRGMEKGKVDYGPEMYRVIRSDKSYAGEISVAVTFIKAASDGKETDFESGQQPKFITGDTCES